MKPMHGLVLDDAGKICIQKALGAVKSEFSNALDSLCDQMNLLKGTISEEGQVTTCPVHYSLSSPNAFYATQVVGTVIGTTEEIMCYLMMVHTAPLLKTHTSAYIGKWCDVEQIWEFTNQ